jgi:hypothetical protein
MTFTIPTTPRESPFPLTLPKYSYLNIYTGADQKIYTADSICGIDMPDSTYSSNCSVTATLVKCVIPSDMTTSVSVCCFGVLISSAANTKVNFASVGVQLDGLSTKKSENTASTTEDLLTYTPTSNATVDYVDSSNPVDLASLDVALPFVTYMPAQENAIGSVTFKITLKRAIERNGKLVFQGVFTAFTANVGKANVRCRASIGDTLGDWANGDSIIQDCDISAIDTVTSSIVVNTKEIFYKCKKDFSSTISINLSPATMGKIIATNNYFVKLFYKTTEIIKNSSNGLLFTTPPVLSAAVAGAFTSELCSLPYVNVSPRFPGALVNWKWDFVIADKALKDSTNEVTIFLPTDYFGDYANSNSMIQVCQILLARVPCSFSRPGVLNVSLGANITANFSVTLLNVPIGAIDMNLTFFCAVTKVATDGTRVQLINGSGVMKDTLSTTVTGMSGITHRAATASTYNLLTYPANPTTTLLAYGLSSSAPNDVSTLTIRTGIDFYQKWKQATLPLVTFTKPTFYVFLPDEFKGVWYQFKTATNYKPIMTVSEQAFTVATGTFTAVASSPKIIALDTTMFSGNIIMATALADFTTDAGHRYFTITISGLVNPVPITTGNVNIAIADASYSVVARTWTSNSSQMNANLPSTYKIVPALADTTLPITSQFFTFSRGYLVGGTDKWNAFIYADNKAIRNNIVIRGGRYSMFTWEVDANLLIAQTLNAQATITLVDDRFVTLPGAVTVLNTIVGNIMMSIGAKCGSVSESYVVFPSTSETKFYPLPPVEVKVDNSTKGNVNFAIAATTFPGGTLPGTYTIAATDANVDPITISWTANAVPVPATTGVVSSTVIPVNTLMSTFNFSIMDSKVTTAQSFTLVTLTNLCFQLNSATLSVLLTDTLPTFPSSDVVTSWFTSFDPTTDTVTNVKMMNALHWDVKPTIQNINMYCALVCLNAVLPTVDVVASQTVPVGPLSAQSTFYFAKTDVYQLIMKGLVRGQAYKLFCLFQTTQADVKTRANVTTTLTQRKVSSLPDVFANYATLPVQPSICLTMTFTVNITVAVQSIFLNYVQGQFSPATGVITGCVIVVDDKGTTAAGFSLPLPASVTCPSPVTTRRQLQDKPVVPVVPVVVPTFPITLCAVPSVTCATDLASGRRLRDLQASKINDVITRVKTVLSDPAKVETTLGLKQANIGLQSVSIVSDATKPDISSATFDTTSNTVAGMYSVKVNYALTDVLNCYYQVTTGTTLPLATAIQGCTSTTNCGMFKLKAPSAVISGTVSPAFTPGTTYSIFLTCYNPVPGATKNSDVRVAYTFAPICPTGQTAQGGVCVTTVVPAPVPAPTPSTSTNYLMINLMMMLVMLFIIA